MQHTRIFVASLSLAAFVSACASDATDSGSADTSSVSTVDNATTDSTSVDSTIGDSTTSADTGSTSGSGSTDTTSMDDRLNKAADALKDGDFTTMLRLLRLSGVADEIEGHEITILAPTDEAFKDISSDDLQNLLTNPTQIDDVLKRHIIDELLTYDELSAKTEVTTMSGDTLTVENNNGEVTVDGAVVSPPESDATSGENGQELAVFAIDRVLLEGS